MTDCPNEDSTFIPETSPDPIQVSDRATFDREEKITASSFEGDKMLLQKTANLMAIRMKASMQDDVDLEEDCLVFCEIMHPIDYDSSGEMRREDEVSHYQIEAWILKICTVHKLHFEIVMYVVAYIEKGLVPIYPRTWRWLLLVCFLIADKVFIDKAVHASDYQAFFPRSDMCAFVRLEKRMLHLLDFDVHTLSAREYIDAYCDLELFAINLES